MKRKWHPTEQSDPAPGESMTRTIRIYGDPVLEQMCTDITDFKSAETKQIITDLLDTCKATPNSAGLAAPQIGIVKRVAVISSAVAGQEDFLVLINPRIISQGGRSENEEGCLSIPGHFDKLARPEHVIVEYQDTSGDIQTIKGTGFFARALVHEIDHLDGRLFIHYFGSAYCNAVKEWLGRQCAPKSVYSGAEPYTPPAEYVPPAEYAPPAEYVPPLPEASFVQAEGPDDDITGEMADPETI
jgi:peptide deformylase